MKNIVLCFDSTVDRPGPRDATNVETLFRLLDDGADAHQLTWYDAGAAALGSPRVFDPTARRWQRKVAAAARESVVDAYFYMAENWAPGDKLFLVGAGRGAYCARALARMLGTVGILGDREDNVVEFALAAYALPTLTRTAGDWRHIHRTACALSDGDDVAVPVEFLGLWDTVKVPGAAAVCEQDWLPNVVAGRHALAIDGGSGPYAECRIGRHGDTIDEVWFRGSHADVVGGPKAYWPLADITLDWMIDGLLRSGAVLDGTSRPSAQAPGDRDALTGGARSRRWRKLPADAHVHASVEDYLRAHPDYRRRLPPQVIWSESDRGTCAESTAAGDDAPTEQTGSTDEIDAVAS
jgi:uncharacterized protein (DUF2235 family)